MNTFNGRTFLVGNKSKSCSLRIDDVRDTETYYPCINENINCDQYSAFEKVLVQVSDTPHKPVLNLPTSLNEGISALINCSVQHTCTHNPPVLEWNKVGFNKREWREELEEGIWKFVSEMDYIPTYQDHGTPIECKSIYQMGQVLQEQLILKIQYPPKHVIITKPDGEKKIKEGEQVTLQCTSNANPPAKNYTWYRINKDGEEELKEHGENLTLTINWEIVKYSCSARNELGKNYSTIMDLSLFYPPKHVIITKPDGEKKIKAGEQITLKCTSNANPPAKNYTWYRINKDGEEELKEHGENLTLTVNWENVKYSCSARNELGKNYSAIMDLSLFLYAPDNGLSKLIMLVAVIIVVPVLLLILYCKIRGRKLQCCQGRNHLEVQICEDTYMNTYMNVMQSDSSAKHPQQKGAETTDNLYMALQKTDPNTYVEFKVRDF
ncbi:B-cell receptor CD22-like [Xenopus laevis]|uniref:B-cell receptor CD22-like n=1 Tax=Xenopus laevis TaxID=8355 RepID=A0A8J1LAJ0_XENLA|nr:B-cell receptor CD22-like [Xenopus laevis]